MTVGTILILACGFRWDYLGPTSTPNMYALIPKAFHIQRVQPAFGFCERSELLTGQDPRDSGVFTAIGFDPNGSPYRSLAGILSKIDKKVHASSSTSRVIRRLLQIYGLAGENRMRPYNIPLRSLSQYRLTEDYNSLREHPQGILLTLQAEGRLWNDASFTSLRLRRGLDDSKRLHLALKAIEKQPTSLHLIYLGEADALGHQYGPKSRELAAGLLRLDDRVSTFVEEALAVNPELSFVFVGDHGMLEVVQTINAGEQVRRIAERLGLDEGTDFHMFLDSTLVRLWGDTAVIDRLHVEMSQTDILVQHGDFIRSDSNGSARIPFPDPLYGDLLWAVKPGGLISPSYFHTLRKEPKGMHGYPGSPRDQDGTCLILSPSISPGHLAQAPLTTIHDYILSTLEDHV